MFTTFRFWCINGSYSTKSIFIYSLDASTPDKYGDEELRTPKMHGVACVIDHYLRKKMAERDPAFVHQTGDQATLRTAIR